MHRSISQLCYDTEKKRMGLARTTCTYPELEDTGKIIIPLRMEDMHKYGERGRHALERGWVRRYILYTARVIITRLWLRTRIVEQDVLAVGGRSTLVFSYRQGDCKLLVVYCWIDSAVGCDLKHNFRLCDCRTASCRLLLD